MLDKIDLSPILSKADYKKEMDELEERLKILQQTMKELQIPIAIVLEGWSSSGKGTISSRILYPMDPRYFNVYTMDKVSEDMDLRPYLWAYWTKMPEKGRIAIFDKSWHRILHEDGSKWNLRDEEKRHFYDDINSFERQLTDDGVVIIKLFLHISKDEQKKRFKELEKNKTSRWRVDERDWEQNDNYNKVIEQFGTLITKTGTTQCPWHIIEANDRRYAAVKACKIIVARIEQEIKRQRERLILEGEMARSRDFSVDNVGILSSINPYQEISKEDYKKKIHYYQKKMHDLSYGLYSQRKSMIILYEGWDAAGKGGNIKRLIQEVDPRAFEVVPIAAPTQEELNHHYLWRFWKKIPKDGHITIFDRSWYGRVLVERAEKLCTTEEGQRAYREINEMEKNIANHGTIVLKFWMQIDKEEQLRRFESRKSDPLKQFKITDEDWRNREKWDLYEQLVNEMLFRTSTDHAPWCIIEANNKQFARIKVLETVVNAMENLLREK